MTNNLTEAGALGRSFKSHQIKENLTRRKIFMDEYLGLSLK
jgi:hypothetical protein